MINKYIDHTLLKATATTSEILKLCAEAKTYNFMSVCINPVFVSLAKEALKGTNVLVCTVIGFPLGANTTTQKCHEAKEALKAGADELDMVINIGKAKEHDYEYITNEIREIKKIAKNNILKVILETCYLTNDEKLALFDCCIKANANFVKTSTGFGSSGATIEDIDLMKKYLPSTMQIKASGGIRTYEDALLFIKHGASRIGTSGCVAIMNHDINKGGY